MAKIWQIMYRMIPLPYYTNKVDITDVLKVIQNYYSYLPKQGTNEWKAQRSMGNITDCLVAGKDWLPKMVLTVNDKKVKSNPYNWTIDKLRSAYNNKYLPRSVTIGGSEITGLVKSSSYKAIWQVAAEKLHGKSGFDGNTDTRWGTLFENIVSKVMQWNLHAKSIELGAIPGDRLTDGSVYQKFSPDNLMLCKLSKYKAVFADIEVFPQAKEWIEQQENLAPDPYIIVILEYKCPTKRETGLFIPDSYTWQPRTGVVITPKVDVGLFVDSSFRKCGFVDFNLSNSYCLSYFEKDLTFKEPLQTECAGFIGFEVDKEVNSFTRATWDISVDPKRVDALLVYLNYDLSIGEVSDSKKVAYACRLAKRLPFNTDICRIIVKICSKITSLSDDEIKSIIQTKLPDYYAIEGLLDWGMAEPPMMYSILAESTKRNGEKNLHPYYPNGAYKANSTWQPNMSNWQDYSITGHARATDWLVRNMARWVRNCSRKPIAVMCWKLMKCKIVPVIPCYPETYKMFEKAKYAVNLLNSVRTLPEKEQLEKLQSDPKLGGSPVKSRAKQTITVTNDEFEINI